MDIVTVDRDRAAQFTDEVVELAYATGSSTYDYQFGSRTVFDRLVGDSWLAEGTLYGYDETVLAIEGDDLAALLLRRLPQRRHPLKRLLHPCAGGPA